MCLYFNFVCLVMKHNSALVPRGLGSSPFPTIPNCARSGRGSRGQDDNNNDNDKDSDTSSDTTTTTTTTNNHNDTSRGLPGAWDGGSPASLDELGWQS